MKRHIMIWASDEKSRICHVMENFQISLDSQVPSHNMSHTMHTADCVGG